MDDLTCHTCERPISIDEPFERLPGVTTIRSALIRHVVCPPGRCASCNTDRRYAELKRVEFIDGELDDPDVLVCANVYACQVRSGEIDPEDVPQAERE